MVTSSPLSLNSVKTSLIFLEVSYIISLKTYNNFSGVKSSGIYDFVYGGIPKQDYSKVTLISFYNFEISL
jgi:hypothetical protein